MGAEYQGIVADDVTTSDGSLQTVNVSLNGAAPAANIAVPNGKDLFIEDVLINSIDAAAVPLKYKVQQSDDNGGSWFTIEPLALPSEGNVGDSLKANIRVRGTEAGTLIRFRVQTNAAGEISARVSSYLQDSVND